MREVIDVKVVKDYKLLVTFDNRVRKIVDIYPFIKGPMFKSLYDKSFFKKVLVDPTIGTVTWPNEADIDPDVLYNSGIKVTRAVAKNTAGLPKLYTKQTPTNVWSPRSKVETYNSKSISKKLYDKNNKQSLNSNFLIRED